MKRFVLQNPMAVANFIIGVAKKEDKPVTNLKLQKVLFFLQGYCLSEYDTPLINGNFSKWRYGPVEEEVYREFKYYGPAPIESKSVYFDKEKIEFYSEEVNLPNEFKKILQEVISKMLDVETWKLAEIVLSHSSWKDFKDEIYVDKARDYISEEIKSCFVDNKLKLGVGRTMEIVQGLKRNFMVGDVIKICRAIHTYEYKDYVMVIHHENTKTYYLVDLRAGIVIYTTRDFDSIRDFLDTDVDDWEVVDAKLSVSK